MDNLTIIAYLAYILKIENLILQLISVIVKHVTMMMGKTLLVNIAIILGNIKKFNLLLF